MFQVKTTKYFYFYFISMATKNYTTKTAALSATTADMRKVQVSKKIEIGSGDTATKITKDEVSAEDLLIGVDVKNEETGETTHTRQSVKALIDKAQSDATAAAGIHVGTETSMVKGGENGNLNVDADNNGSLDVGVPQKVKGMNFCGNVAVVNNADGTVDFWFMNPDNPSVPKVATESNAPTDAMYVYSGKADIAGLTNGSKHTRCFASNSTNTVKFALTGDGKSSETSSTIMSAENKVSKIRVVVTNGAGTAITSVETPEICEENTTQKARGGTITTTKDGVTITLTDVINNKVETPNINDAKDGYTPGYVRFKGSVSINSATVLGSDGGTYKATVEFYNGSKYVELGKTANITHAYQTAALTADDAPEATLSYNVSTTKTISGLTYDSAAKVKVDVTGIKGTQRGGAHIKAQNERAYTSNVKEGFKADGKTEKAYVNDLAGVLATSFDTTSGTTQNGLDAVFTGSREAACTNTGDPDKVVIQTGATVQTYEQKGGLSTVAKDVTNTISASTWLQTSAASTASTTSNSAGLTISSFTDDDKRVLAAIDGKTFPATSAAYDNEASLLTGDYAKQLLIQGVSLRYPTTDVTGTYASAKGWRSYTVPVTFGEGKVAFSVTTTGEGSWSNDKIRLFVVGVINGTATAQCLSWSKGDSSSCLAATGAIGRATQTPTSNGTWKVETEASTDLKGFPIGSGYGYTYYIVLQMNEGCNVKLKSLKFA